MQENAFENIVCKMLAILFLPQYVYSLYIFDKCTDTKINPKEK